MTSADQGRDQELAELLREVRALRETLDQLKADPRLQPKLPPDYQVLVRSQPRLPPDYAVAVRTHPALPPDYAVLVRQALPPTYEVAAAIPSLPPDYAVLVRAAHPVFEPPSYEVLVRPAIPESEGPPPLGQ